MHTVVITDTQAHYYIDIDVHILNKMSVETGVFQQLQYFRVSTIM